MSIHEEGVQPEDLLREIEAAEALLDQAAHAHAQAIVDAAVGYGHIKSIQRKIERVGPGTYAITDPGIAMTWLAGRRVPLRGVTDANGAQLIRTATAANIAAGKWRYPGRLEPMEQAANDPAVQAVVAEWQRKVLGDQ